MGVKTWPSCGLVGQISKSPSKRGLQKNHAQLKNQPHPGSQIFEKVASNSLKIENVVFKINL